MTRRHAACLAGVVGLALTTSGCGAAMYHPADVVFAEGAPREEVEARLGKPESSRTLPDGSRVDTYTYTIRNRDWPLLNHRHTAIITYDVGDRLLAHGPPPAYGPSDEGAGPLTLSDVLKGCQEEHGMNVRSRAREECVVRRFAIWGIE